jgi:hypothetical protein
MGKDNEKTVLLSPCCRFCYLYDYHLLMHTPQSDIGLGSMHK